MDDTATIGARLRVLRRWRGMTQAQLGGLAGMDPTLVSMIENGRRPLDRRSQIAALAAALRISEADIAGGPHLSADRMQAEPHAGIPRLRVALQTNTLTTPAVDRARPLAELARMATVDREGLRRSSDYITAGQVLPEVLDELHYHVASAPDEAARLLALQCLVEVCTCAGFMAKSLSYPDLAYLAARRAWEAADATGDPVWQGKAEFVLLHTRERTGAWDRNLTTAERAAARLEPHASDPAGLQVLGMLTLSAALEAAAIQRGDTAQHWLSESAGIASRVPDAPNGNWQSFSTANVNIWRVTVGVERGETGQHMLKLAEPVRLDQFAQQPSRRADFMADVGRGLARDARTRAEAVRWLRRAEDAAPQRIRNSPPARETVAYLMNQSRMQAGGSELRGMAARMGVPH